MSARTDNFLFQQNLLKHETKKDFDVKVLKYGLIDHVMHSDHKPVHEIFEVKFG